MSNVYYDRISKNFNSIKVQLEPASGSERSCNMQPFQFHKGTIRTSSSSSSSFRCWGNFNSIKVQLERTCGLREGDKYPHFNSIKVQLEPDRLISAISSHIFQFHKGTIRTGNAWWRLRFKRDFNSIKVQLEQLIGICVKFRKWISIP